MYTTTVHPGVIAVNAIKVCLKTLLVPNVSTEGPLSLLRLCLIYHTHTPL